jgi:hypothetical protein
LQRVNFLWEVVIRNHSFSGSLPLRRWGSQL